MRVLIAVPRWEPDVALGGQELVVHRCADLEALLVTAATGVADAALVSSELPRVDRDALARLGALGLAVVGLASGTDEQAERRLRQLGLSHVVPAGANSGELLAALEQARAGVASGNGGAGFAHVRPPVPAALPEQPVVTGGSGRVVAVWGPTGAPGRTTVASGLAGELAALGWPTLLVDADPYGGTLATTLGLPAEAPGLAAACRRANLGTLDAASLAELVTEVGPLGVLTGLDRADRWPELRPAALDVVLSLARARAAVTVVDCGFCLEQDEELSYDTLAPRRNGATLATLEAADLVVVVGRADPSGLARLLPGLAELRELLPSTRTAVVLNRVRGSAVPGVEELGRHAGVQPVACVPEDAEAMDTAHAKGLPLAQAAPGSPARQALAALARALVGARSE